MQKFLFVTLSQCLTVTLPFIFSLTALNGYAAVDLSDTVAAVKKDDLSRALKSLTKQFENIEDTDRSDQILLNTWIGLIYKAAQDPNSKAPDDMRGGEDNPLALAMPYVDAALCAGDAPEYHSLVSCAAPTIGSPTISSTTGSNAPVSPILAEFERSLLATALSIKGSAAWQKNDFETGLKLYTAAAEILGQTSQEPVNEVANSTASSSGSKYEHIQSLSELATVVKAEQQKAQEDMQKNALKNLSMSPGKMDLSNMPGMEEMKSSAMKNMLVENIMKDGCSSSSNNPMASMLTSPLLGEQLGSDAVEFMGKLKELAVKDGKSSCESMAVTSGKATYKARGDNKEQEAFYRLASQQMCNNYLYRQENAYQHSLGTIGNLVGTSAEVQRGNKLALYAAAKRPVIDAFNGFLSAIEPIDPDSVTTKGEQRFLEKMRGCGTQFQFTNNLVLAVRGSMARGSEDLDFYRAAFKAQLSALDLQSASSTESTWQRVSALRAFANRLEKEGQSKEADMRYQELMKAIEEGVVTERFMSLLEWTKSIGDYGEFLKAEGKSSRQLDSYLSSTISKFNKFSSTLPSDQSMSPDAVQDKEMESFIDSVNLPISKDLIMQSMADARSDPNSPIGKALAQATVPNTSMDIAGTYVEKIRNRINAKRQFELGLAETYIRLGDMTNAKKWIEGVEGRGFDAGADKRYFAKTNAFQAYLKARYFEVQGENQKASDFYAAAVKYWYFAPPFADAGIAENIFPSTHYLLEIAMEHELVAGNKDNAFQYMEIARKARIGNPVLYGSFDKDSLAKMQSSIESDYKMLFANAEKKATKENQLEAYSAAAEQGEKQRLASVRGKVNPLMPLLTGLDPIARWLSADDLHLFMASHERFSALWDIRGQQLYRADFLVKEKNNNQISTVVAAESVVDLTGVDDMFRSAGSAQDGNASVSTLRFLTASDQQKALNITDAKAQLDGKTTVLSYWMAEKSIYLSVLNKSGSEFISIPNTKVRALINNFQVNYNAETAKQLYNALIAPANKLLNEKVVIIANGVLQNLAFAALVNPANNNYLGDTYVLRTSPYFSAIAFNKQRETFHDNRLAILAPARVEGAIALPAAAKEAEMLKSKYKGQLFLDEQATKAVAVEQLSKSAIFHFSGHASLNENLPDFSYLAVAMDPQQQAALYVQDIRSLELNQLDMVVLSACESGSNTSFNANTEFSALNAAFIEAGAKSVVASHHAVRDSVTLALMDEFYKGLDSGLEKDVALQTAQQHIRNTISESPRDWAAFTLNGDPSPVALR